MHIPNSFIDELVRRADIVDIINECVPLKRQGEDFSACCPFHEERTPSFSVSRDRQFYYCFGCSASGNVLGFLAQFKGLDFAEAVKEVAERLHLEVPRDGHGAVAPRVEPG